MQYLFLYIISIFFSILSGYLIWRYERGLSGLFFFIASLCICLWFWLYFIFFSWTVASVEVLLTLSRLAFFVGVMSVYSLLGFFFFFGYGKTPYIPHTTIWGTTALGIWLMYLYIGTPYIVESISYDPVWLWYREVLGWLSWLHGWLYIIFFILAIWIIYRKIQSETLLGKMRFERIVWASLVLLSILLLLQLVLPLFGIWILERELILFFTGFSLYTLFTLKRYYFAPIWYDVAKIASIVISGIVGMSGLALIHTGSIEFLLPLEWLWGTRGAHDTFDFIMTIVLFFGSYRLISEHIFWKKLANTLITRIKYIERQLSHTTNLASLNSLLSQEMRHVFRVAYSSILYIKKEERHTHPLVEYFQNSATEDIFINDIVFIEEHEHTEWTENLIRAIPKETFLLLPIYGTKDIIIGAYAIGVKPFGDFYDIFEIAALQDIADFLSRHLRYIEVYAELEDISRNLDRKVDEKTIEYNTLISRQRDFISTLSHEIKTPITSSILHLDNIIDDIECNTPRKDIQSELVSLSDQLVETGGLLSRLFSIEYIDRQSSILYYEIVDIRKFLETQFELHKKVHSKCTYRSSIDTGIWYARIDKVQFTQVITNLMNNATQYANKIHSEILLEAYKNKDSIIIIIEDNGKWIEWVDVRDIFDKYTIWNNSVGLGIGLYLCKRIIDLHGGSISAQKGKTLPWARIEIIIPVNLM